MNSPKFRVLITGANGFIGKNLLVRLMETDGIEILRFVRGDDFEALQQKITKSDAVIHLAGENRPIDEAAFEQGNVQLTSSLCKMVEEEIKATGRKITFIFASSIQANNATAYGRSKYAAEKAVRRLAEKTGTPCIIYRLPGVFGKWCKPNYNSVVATFCNNIANNLPISVDNPQTKLRLVYVDDVVTSFLHSLQSPEAGCIDACVEPEYTIALEELEKTIRTFDESRSTLLTARVGCGITRALYATFISYLPHDRFSYEVEKHTDSRGTFVEMLKTPDCGQFSFFTAGVGVRRGGHYHHTKTEKFLVVKGEALFRFRHLLSDELVEIRTNSAKPQIVDTIPGWTHDVTNVGSDELVVMLWANENFDPRKPDTVTRKV